MTSAAVVVVLLVVAVHCSPLIRGADEPLLPTFNVILHDENDSWNMCFGDAFVSDAFRSH